MTLTHRGKYLVYQYLDSKKLTQKKLCFKDVDYYQYCGDVSLLKNVSKKIIANSANVLRTKARAKPKTICTKIYNGKKFNINESISKLSKMLGVNTLSISTLLVATLLGAINFIPSIANAHDGLRMSLQANKVEVQEDGSVTYTPVSTAKSGTVVQYLATYHNTIDKPINDVMVTLPIPINTTFNGEVYPASAQASIDGINFFDMPLMRRVDGTLVKIPYSQYRALRWTIKLLPTKKSAVVALNAIID